MCACLFVCLSGFFCLFVCNCFFCLFTPSSHSLFVASFPCLFVHSMLFDFNERKYFFAFILDADFHETLSTLQIASKVRNIQNSITKNKVSSSFSQKYVCRYRQFVAMNLMCNRFVCDVFRPF